MSNTPTNDDRRLEQMVAYLDGELPPVEMSLVERQLAEDAEFRAELQSIERAWSALDVLPITKVDDKFSQTTMEMVVGVARQEIVEKTRALPIRRRNNVLGKILLVATAATLALLMVRLVRENPNRVLLADLPTIQYMDVYSQIRNEDFLRKLHNEMGDHVWMADLPAADLEAQMADFQAVSTTQSRRDWVEQLDDEDRAALRARYNRFLAMSPQEQSHLRELNTSVATATNRDELAHVLLQYQAWLNTLPASRQFELRNKPVDEAIQEIVTEQRREANNQWLDLSPEEFRRLERVFSSIREQLIPRTPHQRPGPQGPGQFDGLPSRDRGSRLVFQLRQEVMDHRDEWLPQIVNSLSEQNRAKFEQFTPAQQNQQIARWVMQNRRRDESRGDPKFLNEVSQQELERLFVEETDAATKEQLLAMPLDKMKQQLKGLFFRGELPVKFPPNASPFGPPRGRGRGFGPPPDLFDDPRGPRGFGPPPGEHPDDGPPGPPPPEGDFRPGPTR